MVNYRATPATATVWTSTRGAGTKCEDDAQELPLQCLPGQAPPHAGQLPPNPAAMRDGSEKRMRTQSQRNARPAVWQTMPSAYTLHKPCREVLRAARSCLHRPSFPIWIALPTTLKCTVGLRTGCKLLSPARTLRNSTKKKALRTFACVFCTIHPGDYTCWP